MVARQAMLALALVASLLAGCTASHADPGDASQGAAALTVAAGLGAIRGVVVDEAIRPVAGANISLPRIEKAMDTAADGSFAFTDLAPGLYVVEARKMGHDTARLEVEVRADAVPPVTNLVLPSSPGARPYVDSFSADMFATFLSPFIGLGSIFDDVVGQGHSYFFTAPLNANATVVQVELSWSPTTPTDEHVDLVGGVEGNGSLLQAEEVGGASPLHVRLLALSNGTAADSFWMRVDPAPWSLDNPSVPDPSGSVILNQRFQGFAHVFYNLVPPDAWTFVADGPYPPAA